MDGSPEAAELTPEDVERAVDIFTTHLAKACKDCAEEKLNNAALISAVFAGLVEITFRAVGPDTVAVLRQMLDDLDVPGSPVLDPSIDVNQLN